MRPLWSMEWRSQYQHITSQDVYFLNPWSTILFSEEKKSWKKYFFLLHRLQVVLHGMGDYKLKPPLYAAKTLIDHSRRNFHDQDEKNPGKTRAPGARVFPVLLISIRLENNFFPVLKKVLVGNFGRGSPRTRLKVSTKANLQVFSKRI